MSPTLMTGAASSAAKSKKGYPLRSIGAAMLLSLALLPAISTAQVATEGFEQFIGFTPGINGATSPSNRSGVNFILNGSTVSTSGIQSFTPSVAGNKGLSTTFDESASMSYASDYTTQFTSGARSHQMACLVRLRNYVSGASLTRDQVIGVYFGNALNVGYEINVGNHVSAAPTVELQWVNSATSYVLSNAFVLAGVTADTWLGVVIQYKAPNPIGGTNGGLLLWVEPLVNTATPNLRRGSGVTSGTGTVALGTTADARPGNGTRTPGSPSFGGSNFSQIINGGSPRGDVDAVAFWDQADFTVPDTANLQLAIDWFNAQRATRNADWAMY